MLTPTKLCAKRRLQICIKCLIVIMIFGIYFIILLRESIAALEVTNKQTANSIEQHELNRKHHRKSPEQYPLPAERAANGLAIKNRTGPHHRYTNKHHRGHRIPARAPQAPPPPPVPTTSNPIYEYSDELNAAAEHDFSERQSRLWEACARNNMVGTHPPNAWEFFISSGHSLAWCNVFKAASSTWMYYFNILGGYNVAFLQRTKTPPLELARKRFPRPSPPELEEALENSLSFLIVREPFERLLSAYRDKLEGYRKKYYKILGEQIVRKFRKKTTKKTNSGPTFKEFIMFLLENHRSGEHFDEHWSPIYTFCTPCSINFTLIAKVETFQRDSEYIIRQAGLETLLLNKLPRKKIKAITNQANSKTKHYVAKYFSQIDADTLSQLLDVYGPDFELFGYNSSKYFDMVQPGAIVTTMVSTSFIRPSNISSFVLPVTHQQQKKTTQPEKH